MKKLRICFIAAVLLAGQLFAFPPNLNPAFFKAKSAPGGGGGGNYSLVANTFASANSTGGTTPDINTSGATKIFVCLGSFSAIPTPTDNKGNTYTQVKASTSAGGYFSSIWVCLSPTVGTGHHFTTSQASTFGNISVLAFSGGGTGATDVTSANQGGGITTIQPGSITPTTDNQLIICAYNGGVVTTMLINSGFTISDQGNSSAGAEQTAGSYLVQTTAGAVNPTWSETSPGANTMGTAIASFK